MHQYCMPQYPTCTTNARHVYGIRQTPMILCKSCWQQKQIVLVSALFRQKNGEKQQANHYVAVGATAPYHDETLCKRGGIL